MKKLILELKKLDKITYKLIGYGLVFSTIVALFAVSILLLYIFSGANVFYHIGLALIKSSFIFATQFIICGIVVDSIRKKAI